MKKTLILTILIVMLMSSLVLAGGKWTCHYPKELDIKSTEFSTGGGDKLIIYLEVFGYHKEQEQYVTYIDSKGSVGGMFGLGRFTAPEKIEYIPWDKDKIKLKN